MDVEKVLGRPVLDNASASSIFWVIISNKVAFIAPHNCYVKVNFGNRENQAQQRWVKLLTACQAIKACTHLMHFKRPKGSYVIWRSEKTLDKKFLGRESLLYESSVGLLSFCKLLIG